MSKRVKINFETINKDKYEIIPWEKIHETKQLRKLFEERNKTYPYPKERGK